MKIGFFFADLKASDGGVYTFEQDILRAINDVKSQHEIVIINASNSPVKASSHISHVRVDINKTEGMGWKFLRKLVKPWIDPDKKTHRPLYPLREHFPVQKIVEDHKIELVWFLGGFEYVEVPYVFTIVDLQHRLQPAFPEVNSYGWKWDMRENIHHSGLKRCAFCVCGTEQSKMAVERFYGVNSQRIRTIPIPTPSYALDASASTIRTSLPEGIAQPYLLYPAQFWPHKNHIVLLRALKILKDEFGLNFALILCGADKGNLSYVKEQTKALGLEDSVKFMGFVKQSELVALYQHAFAMPYPSLFATDNLPPLEAFALGCPVLAGEVVGVSDQLGDAAMMVNPLDERSVAQAIKKLWDEPGLRQKLIEKGRVQGRSFTARDYVQSVYNLVDEFAPIRRCWGANW